MRLERVNNTEGTTTQDYFGAYMPAGGGKFVFQKGALYRALEEGCWFLADELNLAEPAVLSALGPLLQGSREVRVPGTDKVVTAAPGFRFFATQNPAWYAGRHTLPLSLRGRFVVVQVEEITSREVPFVLSGRCKGKLPMREAEDVGKLHEGLLGTALQLSLRDLIKIANRSELLQVSRSGLGLV